MTTNGTTTSVMLWVATGALSLATGILGWNGVREVDRNDRQDAQIRTVENAIVKIDFIQDDLKEMKADQKMILRKLGQ